MSNQRGTVVWTELMTEDPQQAMRHYAAICGWDFTTMPETADQTEYHLGMLQGQPVVGVMAIPEDDADRAPRWVSYFAVDDLNDAVEQTIAAGGKLIAPPFEVPGTGLIARVTDPTGAEFGLMKPAAMDAQAPAEPGDDGPQDFPV
jgi:predicted enzyme related to lactoylglutathione lyase